MPNLEICDVLTQEIERLKKLLRAASVVVTSIQNDIDYAPDEPRFAVQGYLDHLKQILARVDC